MPKIIKRLVEAIKRDKHDVFAWDTEVRGFGVRVKPSGVRSYLVQYRNQHGRSRRLTIGQHGRLTAEQARRQAKSLLGDVEGGKDPVADRSERQRDTFGAVADEFIKRHVRHKDLRSAKEIERLFDVELKPRWRNRPIDSISRRDVIELLDSIVDRGAPYTANRTLAAIRKLFNWAVDRDILGATPAVRIEPPGKETDRDRVLADEEIKVLWSAWERQGWPFGHLFQLLLVTGQRRSEIAGLRWSELGLENQLWTLPRERTKSDRSHEVPLSSLAVEILTDLPRMDELVFPDSRHGRNPVSGFSKAKLRTDALCETQIPNWRLHDLRRTATTNMVSLGTSHEHIGRVLNHSPKRSATDIYDRHSYLPEKRRALDAWGSKLLSIIRPPPSNVVTMAGHSE